MKLMAAQINPTIGDLAGNVKKIIDALQRAKKLVVDIVLFPELSVTGYPPEDLLLDPAFIAEAEAQLEVICPFTKGLLALIGLPRSNPRKGEKFLCNSAAVFRNGELIGFKDKTLLPTYDVFDERRYFEPGDEALLVEYLGWRVAVTICEDIWHSGALGYTNYEKNPVVSLKKERPDLLLNLSSSPYSFQRKEIRIDICKAAAKTLECPVVLCNQVGANDQLVFDGYSLHVNEKGELLHMAKGFVEEDLLIELDVHACPCSRIQNEMADLYGALVLGVRDYFHKQGFSKALIGLSGGIDSALVACIAKDALGPGCVKALALPSRFSSPASSFDAACLAKRLGIALQEVSIDSLFQHYLEVLQSEMQGELIDLVKENLQARIRAMLLMAHSNQEGALLLNTSNKSEVAMGYTTLYGDLCGGFAVISDLLKSRVYELCHFVNQQEEIIPQSILDKVPSAELRPHQTDLDSLPPYEILDPILEDYLEKQMSLEVISQTRNVPLPFVQDLIQKVHAAEYKRRQAPLGIRVTQKAFTKGRVVPVVQRWR
ncbi:MAG: NAD+ synthase [Chlamydiales bacterium]|nr:NAD+ synthase [Chlamydiales bacterium]